MKRKAFIAAVAVAAATGLVVSGASANGGNAKTKVTIKAPGGDVYGYVKSTKPNRCADDRKVKVFRQKGGEPGRRRRHQGRRDTAEAERRQVPVVDRAAGVSGKKIYARAGKIPGCRADNSRTIVAG